MIRRAHENVTPALEAYAELLLKLHRQIAEGNGESDESNALRDHMDVYWNYLDEDQLEIIRQLSADLYAMYEENKSRHPRMGDLYSSDLAAEMVRAHQARDYVGALKLLSTRPSEISYDRAAILRGISYRELGLVQAGLVFMWHAAETSQNPDNAYVSALNTLWHYVNVNVAATQAMELVQSGRVNGIALKFIVAGLLLTAAADQHGLIRAEFAEASKALFVELLSCAPNDSAMVAQAKCHELLSHCYYLLGQTTQAINELREAIRIVPADEGLYVQSGLMKLDGDFDSAKLDFEMACKLDATSVWPYYYLAFDAFRCASFEQCARYAQLAITKASDLELQGKLHELVAMSIASGSSSLSPSTIETIRSHFRTGMILSPADQEILENSQIFENALREAVLQHGWVLRPPVTSGKATTLAINERLPGLVSCG